MLLPRWSADTQRRHRSRRPSLAGVKGLATLIAREGSSKDLGHSERPSAAESGRSRGTAAGGSSVAADDRSPDDGASGDGIDAAGYMWGMNIITGKSREEEEAEAEAAAQLSSDGGGGSGVRRHASRGGDRADAGKLVELRYGSYQGVQLSVAEVRRIKAEECRELLGRRKLSLVLDLDHTLLNSATYMELDADSGRRVEAWARGGAAAVAALDAAAAAPPPMRAARSADAAARPPMRAADADAGGEGANGMGEMAAVRPRGRRARRRRHAGPAAAPPAAHPYVDEAAAVRARVPPRGVGML